LENKLRYYEIAEARRNPEKNPKIGVLDDLKQYANDPNIFISFTGDTTTRFRVNYLYNPRMQSEIEFYLTNVIDQD
jgi:hypothetical protein